MPGTGRSTIAEFIRAAPLEGRPHLRHLHTIRKCVAPEAQEKIRSGARFVVEPRFLFSRSGRQRVRGRDDTFW